MNTIVTSKEAILQASRSLIKEQGWTAVNIRAVASACGVSVGSIYNYFNSKADLTAAAIESVWCDIFHFPEYETDCSFFDCIQWIYRCMEKGGEKYPGFFSLHSMSFLGDEKSKGQQRMQQSWHHIKDKLYSVLIKDESVRPDAFNTAFTPEKFIELVFSLIISALLQQNYDSAIVLEVVRRSIY